MPLKWLLRTGVNPLSWSAMNVLEDIEKEIESLPREDFLRLRDWVQRRFEDEWDREFAEDAASGRLDALAESALSENRAGSSTPFPPDEEPRCS